jgi:ubiquinone/menaquinone biosynthesis C-methylase UbiE
LPDEHLLKPDMTEVHDDEILEGTLKCPRCKAQFPIEQGIAYLDPAGKRIMEGNKYELEEVVSSYMWTHYGDLLDDEHASDAYRRWSEQMAPHSGIAMDLGGAVGRFAFEMSTKCDLAVGIDNSVAFIQAARRLMQNREVSIHLKMEGNLTREVTIRLPEAWKSKRVEFIVGDAQNIPFKSGSVSSLASLNLVDKLPLPIRHLTEMNRVTTRKDAQFLLSDPFSWSEEAADEENWLGGTSDGPFAGRGLENIVRLLSDGENSLTPAWTLEDTGSVWWKIRTHANHYELIQSCYVKASR